MKKQMEEYRIIQNNEAVLSSNQSLWMIWNNLKGKNLQGEAYREYIDWALRHGFKKGEIQLEEKGIVKDRFVIK